MRWQSLAPGKRGPPLRCHLLLPRWDQTDQAKTEPDRTGQEEEGTLVLGQCGGAERGKWPACVYGRPWSWLVDEGRPNLLRLWMDRWGGETWEFRTAVDGCDGAYMDVVVPTTYRICLYAVRSLVQIVSTR